MNKNLRLLVLAPEGALVDIATVDSVRILLENGSIGVRPGHAPFISATQAGDLQYEQGGETHLVKLERGILHVRENVVAILTGGHLDMTQPTALQPDELEFDRLVKALFHQLSADTGETVLENGEAGSQ